MSVPPEYVTRVVQALTPHANPARAEQMSAYMRDMFPFLGVTSPERKALVRDALAGMPKPDEPKLLTAADSLWDLPEREYQYVACDLLVKYVRALTPAALPTLERLIVTRSWWDTVDAIATRVVGSIALTFPETRPQMDTWRDSDEMWLVRTAILHQEKWKGRTDADWVFAACAQHAEHRDFFIRKAIGWVLRSYAKTDPVAVQAFVDEQGERLSGLSRREALRGVLRAPRQRTAPGTGS
jgi:3-methyladenine DNA glycosylase AlkD